MAIGKPINGLDVRITKDDQVITNEEVEGALEVKGDFIFDGYINNDEENLLLSIWSDVLNIERNLISLDDDFFSLGGNSISLYMIYIYEDDLNIGSILDLRKVELLMDEDRREKIKFIYTEIIIWR